MEAKYFLYIDDEVKGPFDEKVIKKMALSHDDLIYTSDNGWKPLKTIKNFYLDADIPPKSTKQDSLPVAKYIFFAFILIGLVFLGRTWYEQDEEKRFGAEQREYESQQMAEKMQQRSEVQQKITTHYTQLANLNIDLNRAETRISRYIEELDNVQSFQIGRTFEERDNQVYAAKRNLEKAKSEYYAIEDKIAKVNKAIVDLSKLLAE